MGIIHSRIPEEEEEIVEVYHVSETFSDYKEWLRIVKEYDHYSEAEDFSEINITRNGLQPPFSVYAIQGIKNKAAIQKICHDQPQINACHTVLLFCAKTSFILSTESLVESQRTLRQRIRDYWNPYYVDKYEWAKRQTYYSVGFAIQACEKEHVACYAVEGFNLPNLITMFAIPFDVIPVAMLTIGTID